LANSKAIESLVRSIVEGVHPLKIVLFGSCVREEANPDSEIAVPIVMPEGVRCRWTAQLSYRQIKGLGTPFDILVTTASDLERHKDNIGLIYRNVLQQGKDVYAA